MNSINVLLLGSTGLIGISLVKNLQRKYNVFTTCHSKKHFDCDIELDIRYPNSIERAFHLSKPNVVINLCGIYKNLEFCEKNKELAMEINGLAPKYISEFSNKYNAFLISMSSDFVFDGNSGNYKESDPVSPINYYGMTKVEGEKNIQNIADNYCIVRPSMIYGKSPIRKTLPYMILEGIKKENGLNLIEDQYMTPTYLENFCNMLVEIIEKRYYGIIHLAGPEKMSRYDFAIKLLNKLGLNKKKIIPVKRNDFEFGKKMPRDSSLNTEKANEVLEEKPESVEKAFSQFLK